MESKVAPTLPSIHSWKMDPFQDFDEEYGEMTEDELWRPPTVILSLFDKIAKGRSKKEGTSQSKDEQAVYTFRKAEFGQIRREILKLARLQIKAKAAAKPQAAEILRLQEECNKLSERIIRDQETIKQLQSDLSRLKPDNGEAADGPRQLSSPPFRSPRANQRSEPLDQFAKPHIRAAVPKTPKSLENERKQKMMSRGSGDLLPLTNEAEDIQLKGTPFVSPVTFFSADSVVQYTLDHPALLEAALKPLQAGTKVERNTPTAMEEFYYIVKDVMEKCPTSTRLGLMHGMELQSLRLGSVIRLISGLDLPKGPSQVLQQVTDGITFLLGGCFAAIYLVDFSREEFYISGNRYLNMKDDTQFLTEAVNGESDKCSNACRIPWGNGIVGYVRKHGKVINTPFASKSSHFSARADLIPIDDRDYSVLTVGIQAPSSKATVAVMQIYRNIKVPKFTRQDEVLLQLIAYSLRPHFGLISFPDHDISDVEKGGPHPCFVIAQKTTPTSSQSQRVPEIPSSPQRGILSSHFSPLLERVQDVVKDIKDTVAAEFHDLYIHDSAIATTYCLTDAMTFPRISNHGLFQEIAKSRKTVNIANVAEYPAFGSFNNDFQGKVIKTALFVTFSLDSAFVYICRLTNKTPAMDDPQVPKGQDVFTIFDEEKLKKVWAKHFQTIEQIRDAALNLRLTPLPERSQYSKEQSISESRAIIQSMETLATEISFDSLAKNMVNEVSKHIPADRIAFYATQPTSDSLSGWELFGGELKSTQCSKNDSIAGVIATLGKDTLMKDPFKDARFIQCADRKMRPRPLFSMTLLVRVDDAIVGVLHLVNRHKMLHPGSWPVSDKKGTSPANVTLASDPRYAPPQLREGVHYVVAEFSPEDETLARLFVNFSSKILKFIKAYNVLVDVKESLKKSFAEAEASHKNSSILLATAHHIYDSIDPDEVARKVILKAQQLVGADRCALFLIDTATKELYTTVAAGISGGGILRLPMGEGLAGYVATTGEVLNIADAHLDKRFNPEIDKKTGYRTKALLCMPIKYNGRVIGVCQMLNKKKKAVGDTDVFGKQDEMLFESFSVLAGLALQNSMMHNRVKTAQTLAESNLKRSEMLQSQQKVIMEMATKISQDLSTTKVISTIMNEARRLVDADRCTLFLVDKKKNELYSTLASGVDQLRIPLDRGLAGHVATTGENLNIPDAYADARFNRDIDLKTGYQTRTILCMPIRHGSEVIGVAQMVNKKAGEFSVNDEVLFEAFSVFCGISLRNASLYEDAIAARRQLKSLLEITLTLSGEQDVSMMIRSIMKKVQDFVEADSIHGFAVDDEQSGNVYAYDQQGNQVRQSLRAGTKESDMMQAAAIGGEVVHQEIQSGKDHIGAKHKLLVPIRTSTKKVAGVIELINNRKGGFTKKDQDLVEAFATFCGVHLRQSNTSTGDSNTGGETGLSLDYYESKFAIAETIKKGVKDWSFEFWDSSHDELIGMIAYFFEDLGLMSRFKLSKLKLYRFLRAISQRYNNVLYHNFQHAFMVTHSVYWLLSHIKRANYIGDLQTLGLLVAAICHDVDHRGTNNTFQVNANTPLAMLYGTSSVMENHHCSVAVHVLTQEENDILSALAAADAPVVWKSIINTILSTDLARYGQHMKKLDDVVKAGYTVKQPDHVQVACDTILAAADVSNIAKKFDVAERWSHIVISEMSAQGETETKLGLQHAMMPTNKQHADVQLGFYNAFGVPLYAQVARLFPELQFLAQQVEQNRNNWLEISRRSQSANLK
eukprot:TRINITY_DN6856_c0_g1_i3.p1 TRINITY_DN6856_c0_g1~~TRINITY_DN6856_c0_g1_i3.p1  ORF type:complete len:1755 (+),score=395.36 TRINITY_DN6856_c0_g1_i3:84-5348(+)